MSNVEYELYCLLLFTMPSRLSSHFFFSRHVHRFRVNNLNTASFDHPFTNCLGKAAADPH